ncbi:MAG: tyrosine-type recombinase/integrase, partial [Candidatus Limnocylindria bacterium]
VASRAEVPEILEANDMTGPGDDAWMVYYRVRRDDGGEVIEAANAERAKATKPPIQAGVTNHTLRRTFASLLYEAGASPAYVMAQMGHASSSLALEIYARKMDRDRETGARMGRPHPGRRVGSCPGRAGHSLGGLLVVVVGL